MWNEHTLKRNKLENPKINNVVFKIFAYSSIVGIFFLVVYQLFYGFLIKTFIEPEASPNWGLFLSGSDSLGADLNAYQATGTFFGTLAIFFALPFLNLFLTKKFENNEVIIDTQSLVKSTPTKVQDKL